MNAQHSPQFYIETFRSFLAQGMSHAEAMEQFDNGEWNRVMIGDLENDGGREMLDLAAMAGFEERNRKDFEEQAVPLMLAGWTMETPNPTNSKHFWSQTQIMSLYWRAPSKRPGKPGRKYPSTNQAFNAMKKLTPTSTDRLE